MSLENITFDELYKNNLDFVEYAKKANKFNGLKKHLAEFYPSVAHYIYELLQNAEDALANKVKFSLFEDRLEFIHDGSKLFNVRDIDGITNIGEGNKDEDVNAIGKFGIGFKSVFAYTESPKIYSGKYAFEIIDLFVPKPLPISTEYTQTKFILPFNHNAKSSVDAFEETKNILLNFNDNVILFLNNIEDIEWEIEGVGKGYICRSSYEDNHFEIERNINDETTDKHWLIFRDNYNTGIKQLPISVAFELAFIKSSKKQKQTLYDEKQSLFQQLEILPIDNGNLKGQTSIFFPCDKEEPKLNFHMNGPFSSTPDRAKLIYNKDNDKIINALSELLASSLIKIRDYGLINRNFYKILPNTNDGLNEFYTPLMKRIFKALNEQSLMPTFNNKTQYAPGKMLINTYQAVKELFPEQDFRVLILGNEPQLVGWVDGSMIGAGKREERREEQLLKDLEIVNYDWDEIVSNISSKFSISVEFSTELLKGKDDVWFRKFYLMVNEARLKANNYWANNRLHNCYFVITQTGELLQGDSVFFPVEKRSAIAKEQPKLKTEILEDTKEENVNKLIGFFEELGVKKLNQEEEITLLLNAYYSKNMPDPETDKKHFEHLRKFMSAWSNNRDKYSKIFGEYYIIRNESGLYSLPNILYIDKPYKRTNLKSFYNAFPEPPLQNIDEIYHKEFRKQILKLIDFLIGIGVNSEIKIEQTTLPWDHPDQDKIHRIGNRGRNGFDEDYTITDIDKVLRKKDLKISISIWERMIQAENKQLKIYYQCNSRSELYDEFPSTLVYELRRKSWIPDKKGNFLRPKEIVKENLHHDFKYNNKNGWLTAIGFGEEEEKQKIIIREKAALLNKLGIKEEEVVEFDKFRKLPPDQRKKILQKYYQQNEFPVRTPNDPVRRANKISQEASIAPEVEYENKTRSVRTSKNGIVFAAKTFLLESYTRDNGEMVCQICKDEMPFKLASGIYYFEAVQLIENVVKELDKNYLALCPTCAAKFKYVNPEKNNLANLILKADGQKISLILAGEEKSINFVETHLLDIRTQLESIEQD